MHPAERYLVRLSHTFADPYRLFDKDAAKDAFSLE